MIRKTRLIAIPTLMLIAGIVVFNCIALSFAAADDNIIGDLKKQIQILEAKVKDLESARPREEAQNNNGSAWFWNRKQRTWDPFEELSRMQQEMDRMFEHSFSWGGNASKGMFRSNVFYDEKFGLKEEKDKYVVELEMSDMDRNNIEIQINKNLLTVKGERSEESTQEQKDRYLRRT